MRARRADLVEIARTSADHLGGRQLQQEADRALLAHRLLAAATEALAPTPSGSTMPGNSTVLRIGRDDHRIVRQAAARIRARPSGARHRGGARRARPRHGLRRDCFARP